MTAYGKIHRAIWADPDFRDLTPMAKLLYLHFVSHPKLSKCGVIDIHEDRWARALGVDDVSVEVLELEDARFVIMDRATEELAVRTFVKNDGFVNNWKMLCAMWRAWEGVESAALRAHLAANFPPEVWDSERARPPKAAWTAKGQVESQYDRGSIANGIGNAIPDAIGNPPRNLQPVTGNQHQQPAAIDRPDTDTLTEPEPNHAAGRLTAKERTTLIAAAADLVAERRADAQARGQGFRNSREAFVRGVAKGLITDHADRAHKLLTETPSMTADDLADKLEPPPERPRPPAEYVPSPTGQGVPMPENVKAMLRAKGIGGAA